MTIPSKQPFPPPLPGSASLQGHSAGSQTWTPGIPSTGAPLWAPAQRDPPFTPGGRRGQPGERKAAGGRGPALKLPGCGLRARMLSVLSTSWQQNLGPGRRRRCGNGAARVAELAFASARSREPLSSLPSAPWPPGVGERVRGAGRPAREAPRRGAARELEAARPARAAARPRGGAAWPGRFEAGAEERSGPPGERRARRPRGLAPAGERTRLAIARDQVTRPVPSPSPGRARAPRPRLPRPGAGSRRRRQGARGRPAIRRESERGRLMGLAGPAALRQDGPAAVPRVPGVPGSVLRPRTPFSACRRIK